VARESGFLGNLPSPPPGEHWPPTLWDVIRRARDGSGEDRKTAWDQLFLAYFKPVRRFFERVRRLRGESLDDVTQDFFRRFLEKDFLRNLREEKSFRNFLKLACERHHINWLESNRRHRSTRPLVDSEGASIDVESWDDVSRVLEEELRGAFLEQALGRTQLKLVADGKELYYQIFESRARFDGSKPPDFKSLSEKFSISVFQINNHINAARKVFRDAMLALARERRPDDPKGELKDMNLLQCVE
jgi:DNA-directed RNA polymerase specialized sigma24 family protein